MLHNTKVVLNIADDGTESEALSDVWSLGQVKSAIGSLADPVVYSPVAGTIQIRPDYGTGDWSTYEPGGAELAVAANVATQIPLAAFRDIMFTADSAVGDPTAVTLSLQIESQ